MKLLGRNKLPARLRESVEAAGGSVEMQVSALLRPIGFSSPTPLALAAAEQVIEQAGLVSEPPVPQSGWDDMVVLSFPAANDETRAHEALPAEEDAMSHPQEEPVEAEVEQDQATVLPEPVATTDAVVAESYGQRHRAVEERLQALVERERDAREHAQADAGRRIAEAAKVLDEARQATEIELEGRAGVEQELAAARRSEQEIRDELSVARALVESTRVELDQRTAELLDAERSVAQGRSEMEKELREKGELQAALGQARQEVEAATQRIEQLSQTEASLNAALEEARAQAERARAELEAELTDSRAQTEQVRGELEADRERRAGVEAELGEARQAGAELSSRLEAEGERRAAVEAELGEARQAGAELSSRLEAADERRAVLEGELAEARQ